MAASLGVRDVWLPALQGLAGSVLVTLAAVDGGALLQRDLGSDPWPIDLPHVPGAGSGSILPVLVAFYGGIVLLVRGWLALRRARPPARLALAVAALWMLPLLVSPPIGSRDAYSYIAQGAVVDEGLSAYDHAADDLPPGGIRDGVDPLWFTVPTPYGPAWVRLAATAAALPGDQPFVGVLVVRALAVAGVGLLALGLPRLARRHGADPDDAVVLGVANPLVVVHLIGGAHNEALLAGLVVCGYAAAASGRRYLGVAITTVGGAVKVPGLIAAAILGWGAPPGTPWSQRVRPVAIAGVVAAATITFCSLATLLGFGWIQSAIAPGLVTSWAAPTNYLGDLIGHDLAQKVGLLAAIALAARWTWLAREGDADVGGSTLLAFAVLGPALHPWYVLWGLPLLVAARAGRPNRGLVLASIAAVLAGHIGSGPFIAQIDREAILPIVLAAAALAALAFSSRDLRDQFRREPTLAGGA
jgi:hypothetical protein